MRRPADERARQEVKAGKRRRQAGIATPGGIKQEFPIYPRASAHLSWSSAALKGLGSVYGDRQGPPATMAMGDWEVSRP